MKRALFLIAAAFIVIAGGLAIRQYIRNQGLYLVSSLPKNRGTAGSVDSIVLNFNRELEETAVKSFRLEPSVDGRVELTGKTLSFHPASSYKFGDEYTVTVERPRSKDGKSMADVKIKFKVGFVKNPSKTQEQQARERTNSLQRQYPLLAHVPHETLHFKIDYLFRAKSEDGEGLESEQVLVIKVSLFAVLNRPDQRQSYLDDLKQYKQEALDYIKSTGEDPAKYTIEYNPPEAASL